jgi:hypothetical protein
MGFKRGIREQISALTSFFHPQEHTTELEFLKILWGLGTEKK